MTTPARPGWPDPLDSELASRMRARDVTHVDLTDFYDLFDQMERAIRIHRGTFCEVASLTHVSLQLSGPQINLIMDVAARMGASPENVLKRAIGSYCAKFGGGGQRPDPDLTNIVAISSHQEQS